MGWEYFGVVGFDLGPLLQGQMSIAKIKSAYNIYHILGVRYRRRSGPLILVGEGVVEVGERCGRGQI